MYVYSRTLTSVYDAILEDLVYPAEIVGKRIRVKLDGKQIIKVHLDKTQQTNIEHKVTSSLELVSTHKFVYTVISYCSNGRTSARVIDSVMRTLFELTFAKQ